MRLVVIETSDTERVLKYEDAVCERRILGLSDLPNVIFQYDTVCRT